MSDKKQAHEPFREEPEHKGDTPSYAQDLEEATGIGSVLSGTFRQKQEDDPASEEVRQQKDAKQGEA